MLQSETPFQGTKFPESLKNVSASTLAPPTARKCRSAEPITHTQACLGTQFLQPAPSRPKQRLELKSSDNGPKEASAAGIHHPNHCHQWPYPFQKRSGCASRQLFDSNLVLHDPSGTIKYPWTTPSLSRGSGSSGFCLLIVQNPVPEADQASACALPYNVATAQPASCPPSPRSPICLSLAHSLLGKICVVIRELRYLSF